MRQVAVDATLVYYLDMPKCQFLGAGLLLIAAACSSSDTTEVNPPATVTLGVGDGAFIKGTPWTVIFDSVVSDSRCPANAICVQAGEALLALELASPLADPLPPDNPHFTLGVAPAKAQGFRFAMTKVTPYPFGTRIDPKSYRVTFTIEALPGP